MDSLLLDLRYAFGHLRRRPWFSLLAILTLAIGIGVNTVAFDAVDALLYKPFRFANADRLGWIMIPSPGNPHGQMTWPDFLDYQRSTRAFETLAAEERVPLAWQTEGRTDQIWALLVTADYFGTLSTRAEQGRLLGPEDARRPELAAVVSHRFWQNHLRDISQANWHLAIAGRDVTVIGVLPDTFQGPGGLYEPDLWMPLEQSATLGLPASSLDRRHDSLMAFGLLKPGVTPPEAQADLAGVAAHLSATYPDTNARRGVRLYPMSEGHPELREVAPAVWFAMSAVGLVLIIACFNVSALLLARAAQRIREIAVRSALGASRWRIVRQLVTEGLVLSSISGAVALVLANWSGRLLSAFSLPSPDPQRLHLSIDGRLVAFTVVLAGIAGVLPALIPALKATAGSVMASMRFESTSGTGASSRTRKAFVMAQIAGSTVFLGTAMIFLRAFLAASSFSPGVDMTHPLIVEIQPSLYGYDAARARLLADQIVSRLSAVPGVSAVSVADRVPFFVGYPKMEEASPPAADCAAAPCAKVTTYAVERGQFAALGIPLEAGRDFTADEIRSHRAVIVDETMARQYWPSGSAVGQMLRMRDAGLVEVVGVAAAVSDRGPQVTPRPTLYRPFKDAEFSDTLSLIVRAAGDPLSLVAPVRDALHAIAPSVPLQQVHTMRDRYDMPLWASRTATGLFGICGGLALLLATAGLFGVTYFAVNQRTREFGVRIALGARAADIMRLVLGEGLAMCVPATAVGLVLAAATGHLLARSIVGVRLSDPSTYAIVAVAEVAVALAACALPARRAARSAPIAALRAE